MGNNYDHSILVDDKGEGFPLFAIKTFTLFIFVYNLTFSGYESFGTGRIAFIVLSILLIRPLINNFKPFLFKNYLAVIFYLFATVYSAAAVIFGSSDAIIFSRLVWLFIYSIISPFIFALIFNFNLRKFLKSYILICTIQAIFVYISILSEEFRIWLSLTLSDGGNIDFVNSFRARGLSNSGGAALSLQLSLGVLSALVLIMDKKIHIDFFRTSMAIFLIFIILGAIFFVGRSGFVSSLLYIVFFLFFAFKSYRRLFHILCASIFAIPGMYLLYKNFEHRVAFDINEVLLWVSEIFSGTDSATLKGLGAQLKDAPVMDITLMVFGAGKVSNSDGTNFSGSDSGYIQTIYALGFPMTILIYFLVFTIFFNSLRPLKGYLKSVGALLILTSFIFEIKEPFIFKYYMPFYVLTFLILARQQPYLSRFISR